MVVHIDTGDCSVEIVETADVSVEQSPEAREDGLLGISDAILETFALIDSAATCDIPVLVGGETGTGKELAARAIHRRSERRNGPFVVLDCASLPSMLAEAAILGHCKGAFTGADADRPGAFETADGGSLFLDEIGELPLSLQAKLLRALDRREVMRLGEHSARSVDVRIIAATHRDLATMVSEGQFREDLYHRLAGMMIEVPALRERGPEEIEYLARCFLDAANRRLGRGLILAPEALGSLKAHSWPGNVRELFNVINRATIICKSETIEPQDLRIHVHAPRQIQLEQVVRLGASYDEVHAELDRWYLPQVLMEAGGNVSEAARRLGMGRGAFMARLRGRRS
jgi:transcriptional regulator with GAF, ATPase, and Fis domain